SPVLASCPFLTLALILVSSTFALAFYFSTYAFQVVLPYYSIPIDSLKLPRFGLGVAMLASVLREFGIVALFCSVGVCV
ncbi:hypothetical protein EDC04DRAFT_2991450, partial [Pisolithus marmoratus]